MLRNAFEPWHLVVLILVIAIVFGSKKLPDAARSLGRSMRIFKSEIDEMKQDTPSAASRDTVSDAHVTRTESTVRTEDAADGTTRITRTTAATTTGDAAGHAGAPADGTSTGSTQAPRS